MKKIMISVAAIAAVGACWGAPPNEKILTQLCQDVFAGDAAIMRDINERAETDLDGYCACYGATFAADTAKVDLHKTVSLEIANAREGTNLDTEGGAEAVEALIRSGEIDTFSEDQLMQVGDEYQRLMYDMRRNDGVCPTP
jgi:hypothetical protein